MYVRVLRLLLASALTFVGGAANAEVFVDAARAADGLFLTSYVEQEQGHNHINMTLHEVGGGDATERVRRLEITVTYERSGGIMVRRFSGTVRDPAGPGSITPDVAGTEGFSEDACYPCGSLFVALPHDFGGVRALVDVHLFFETPIPCADGADGLCDSANAFLNSLPLGNSPTLLGKPSPGADATDAVPEQIWLL
jgi:hypothetical protein